jgi:hypothetical protein
MEFIIQEMREAAVELERLADAHIQANKGHRFVDIANREKAVNLLQRFQQGYASNQEFKNQDIGPRFTWRMLKSFAVKLFNAL